MRVAAPERMVMMPVGAEVGEELTRMLKMTGEPTGTRTRARERVVEVGLGAMVVRMAEEVEAALRVSPE